MADPIQTGFTRVFLIENRAGPANVPTFEGLMKASGITWSQGDVTTIRVPSSEQYDQFDTIGKVSGEQGNPELTLTARYTTDLSKLLRLARLGCDHDIQIHMGKCQNPSDFNNGWDKIVVLEAGRATNYTTEDLGALQPSERNMINEEAPFTGEDLYEIKKILFAEIGAAEVVQEVVGITVCDAVNCGACGIQSNGCQVVFAVTLSAGGSPGLSAEVLYTEDGGGTVGDTNVTTLAANEDPDDIACVGANVIVISEDSISLHYADLTDILDGVETWNEVATGFVEGPRAIWNVDPSHTWIVGAGGYVYFTDDPTAGVEVQSAGSATTQPLNDIHALDILNALAVGDNNAVIYTADGSTWGSVTGPAVGINLTCCWMKSATEWFVGTANGRLWYTKDAGVTWTEKAFPGSGAGVVRDIAFSSDTVGYLAHSTAAPAGRILRTISGGNSWYVAPESTAVIPANDYVGVLAVCADVNTVFGGGLAGNAVDGFLVKGS